MHSHRQSHLEGWGRVLILGILMSFLLIKEPAFAALTVVYYTAFALIIAGVTQAVLAFRLRKVKNAIK